MAEIKWDDNAPTITWEDEGGKVQWDDEEPVKSPTQWAVNPQDDRDPAALKSDFHQMSIPRQVGEIAVGLPEAAVGIATQVPGMVAGGLGGISGLLAGDTMEEAAERAKNEWSRFSYTPRTTAGQLMMNDAGEVFDQMKQTAGTVNTIIPNLANKAIGKEIFDENLYRTGGEVFFETAVSGVPGVKSLSHIKNQRVNQARAQELLGRREQGATEYDAWIAEQAKNQEYTQAYEMLDSEMARIVPEKGKKDPLTGMIRYDKDLQAPQYGKGGTVARHADQSGKRERGEFANQEAFDADIARTGAKYENFEFNRKKQYTQAYEQLDSQMARLIPENGKKDPLTGMIRYDKDFQAPHLGKGGAVTRHADQEGKRAIGEYAKQENFDADIARTATNYEQFEFQREKAERESPVNFMPPWRETDSGRRPVEGKTNIIGPAARIKPAITAADDIAAETRGLMQPRDPARPEPIDVSDVDADGIANDVRDMMRPRDTKPGPLGAVKEPGGNWYSEAYDEIANELTAGTDRFMARNPDDPAHTWVSWVEKNTKRYLDRYAGTDKDPLKNIEIPYGENTARWEDLTDAAIASRPAWRYRQHGLTDELDPRIPNNADVWDFNRNSAAARRASDGRYISSSLATEALYDYLHHVRDYVDTHIRPEDLKNYDFTRLVRETAEWDKKLAKNMEKKQKDSMKNATVYKDYGDGFKWIKLDKPGQFAQESDMMGHSVRGYEPAKGTSDWNEAANNVPLGVDGHPNYGLGGWDAIKRGDAEVYSLRDPQGRAHVTIEVSGNMHAHKGEEYHGTMPDEITQIKGKQNRAPDEKYLKYVQDFVKSREWGDIGDLQNSGLNSGNGHFRTIIGYGIDDLDPALQTKYLDDYRLLTEKEFIEEIQRRYEPDWQVMSTGTGMDNYAVYNSQGQRVSRQWGSGPRALENAKEWLDEARQLSKLPGRDSNLSFNYSLHNLQDSNASVREQLGSIASESKIPYYKKLAEFLLEDKTFNPRFEILENKIEGFEGYYQPSGYKVQVFRHTVGQEGLLLHEVIHARTHGAIEAALRNPRAYPQYQPAVRRLQELYLAFRDQMPNSKEYGLTNIHEFIAEGFSNPDFQALLARTELPASLKKKKFHVFWDVFIDRVGQLLGLNRADRASYLDEVIKTGVSLMREADSPIRRAFEDEGVQPVAGVGGYSLGDFKSDLKVKGIKVSDAAAKALYEASKLAEEPKENAAHPKEHVIKHTTKIPGLKQLQQEYADSRTWEEMLPEAQKSTDVSMVHKNTLAKIIAGKYTAMDHPLWSWISSQIHQIKHNSFISASGRLHGKNRKNPDPGTYNHTWRQLSAKEREAVNEFGWKHNNSERPVTSVDLAQLSPKQRQAYQDRIRINKQVLADVNKVLVDEGKEPIPEQPNYWSPIILDEPFIVKFKDKTGETKKIAGFYLKPDMKKLEAVAAEHGMTSELQPERGLKGELDFEQLDWVLRHISKEQRDPAAKAITEGLRRQGFMKHGIKRKGVEGGAGSLGGRRGLREYEETSEKYIRRAYEFIANRHLDKIYKQVLDEKSLDSQPYAKGFALEAIDTARGGANKTFEGFSKFLGDVVSGTVQIGTLGKIKLPNRFTRDLLRHSNKIKTTLLLGFGNVTNIAANGLQAWTYAPPAIMAAAAKTGMSTPQMLAATFNAMHKASSEMLKWDDSKDIQKLREIGALDATFKYDWSTYASDSDPRYSNTAAEHLTGISTLSYIESNAVRRPASLMFLNMLREIGYDRIAKNKDEIYYVAKEMTDKYMVSTRWYEKPHAFSRSGLVGTAISPLQSFTTTWVGMLKEYTQLSAQGLLEGSVAKQVPLAVFISMNVLTAGLLGLIGIKEWDAIANLVNKWFGTNIPTGTEWIMSTFKNNKLRFGVLSDAVGFHIGATFNAPTLTGSFMPGVQQIGDVANMTYQSGRYAANQMGVPGISAPTAVERRDALKGVTPRFSWFDRAGEVAGLGSTGMNWADIEEQATPEDAPYQDMAGNAGPITRTPEDKMARKFGTYTINEAEEKTTAYIAKKEGEDRSKRLSSSIEKMADMLIMSPDDPNVFDKLEPFLAKLEAEEYKGSEIKNALKRELLNKLVESDVRSVGKGKSSKQAIIYRLLEELR